MLECVCGIVVERIVGVLSAKIWAKLCVSFEKLTLFHIDLKFFFFTQHAVVKARKAFFSERWEAEV